jgi:multidrug efflux pump subunit AcrB
MTRTQGIAGPLARAFIHSRLTPLLMLAALLSGLFAVLALPREEEPQIVVPMVDVFVQMPGAAPAEVEQRLARPLEKLLWEVPGVEYVYSTSSSGQATVIVRFYVGEDEEKALVRLREKIEANPQLVPPGASAPLVQARSIDDVPVMAVTFSGDGWDDHRLRLLAAQIRDGVKEVPDVSDVTLIGGRRREVQVVLEPSRLAAHRLDPGKVRDALGEASARQRSGELVQDARAAIVEAGVWAASPGDVARTIVSAGGPPIRLADVATIADGPAEPESYVTHRTRNGPTFPAVTIAIAKRKGANAIDVTRRVEEKLDMMRGVILPADVTTTITRNYGETAADKSNELLWHMFLAVLSVSALIWLALGRREAAVVLIAVPVTLALTLFVFYLYGYTLNRITLFALIFSIGILVDDAIVVVENVVRHARARPGDPHLSALVVQAVSEVGNPTILATLTVVAAILPMAFVGGLMGPYMRPIPVGASAAMLFSLLVAFIVTPWAAVRMLGRKPDEGARHEDRLTATYRRIMGRLIRSRRSQLLFLGGVAALLMAAAALVPLGVVTVKMLPFDNKSEFQVLINMSEGTPLEDTARVADLLADETLSHPEVISVQTYAGAASPYNFNGLVRHYFLRRGAHQADLQVNLAPKDERGEQSHAIASRVREKLAPVAQRLGARIQVAEVPPGPPVLQTLVAEIYGPDPIRRLALASDVRAVFNRTPGVVDVDWYVESPQASVDLAVDTERAASAGVPPARVAAVARMAGNGEIAGLLHDPAAREDVPIVVRLPRADRGTLDALLSIRLHGAAGDPAIGELVQVAYTEQHPSLYHKNLMPVTYVVGDVAGGSESPVYAILQMNRALEAMRLPEGYGLEIFSARQPSDSTRYAMKWDGEWHITYEVFRDLGLAFAGCSYSSTSSSSDGFNRSPPPSSSWPQFRSRSSASCQRTQPSAPSSPRRP